MRKLVSVLLSLLLLTAALSAATPAQAALNPISGAGSTWSQNAIDQWRSNVKGNYGLGVNYDGVGSTSGRKAYIEGMVDFAISEIPFVRNPGPNEESENPQRPYAYMPIVAGGTSLMYHLKVGGKRVTNLRLSGEVVAKVFTGKIKNWNDPAIQAENPAIAMPDRPITPVIRSDGSGTTAQFTTWLSQQYPSIWTEGRTSQFQPFPGAKPQKGSDGVAGYISQNYGEGSIGYVEYSYARNAKFPVAKLLNAAGYYVEPTALSVAVALTKARINTDQGSPDYLTQVLTDVFNHPDPRAYPMSSYSYAIVPTQASGSFTEKKGESLATFMRYVLCEGQQTADPLGYSPLPGNLVQAGSDQIKKIPGSGGTGLDLAKCNNPTFKGNPNDNHLAQIAPMPKDCDKKGEVQCVNGTGGAKNSTPVTGTGKGVDQVTGKVSAGAGAAKKPGTDSSKAPSGAGSKAANTKDAAGADAGSAGSGSAGSGGAAGGGSDDAGSSNTNDASTESGDSADAGDAADGSEESVDGADPADDPAAEDPDAVGEAGVDGEDAGGSGGGSGSRGGAASVPYKMADDGFGAAEWMMLLSSLLLLGVVGIPPFLLRRNGGLL